MATTDIPGVGSYSASAIGITVRNVRSRLIEEELCCLADLIGLTEERCCVVSNVDKDKTKKQYQSVSAAH